MRSSFARWDSRDGVLTQRVVLCRCSTLALTHIDCDLLLIFSVRLVLFGHIERDLGVALDNDIHFISCDFDTERERCDINDDDLLAGRGRRLYGLLLARLLIIFRGRVAAVLTIFTATIGHGSCKHTCHDSCTVCDTFVRIQ